LFGDAFGLLLVQFKTRQRKLQHGLRIEPPEVGDLERTLGQPFY
jgi:hypothetical protein